MMNDEKYVKHQIDTLTARALFGPEVAYKNVDPYLASAYEGHYMDLSTGTWREKIALNISGAVNYVSDTPPNYDGIRNTTLIESKPELKRTSLNKKSYGRLCINDSSWSRHERFLEDNLILQHSLFIDGLVVTIIEFPYRDVETAMAESIKKTSQKNRILGEISYKNWINSSNINIILNNKELVEKYNNWIVGGNYKKDHKKEYFYQWLINQKNVVPKG